MSKNVRQALEGVPGVSISLPGLLKHLVRDGDGQTISLTVRERADVQSREWWTLSWTDETHRHFSACAQTLGLLLERAAQMIVDANEATWGE
jgi:hypothetical protein